MNGHIVESLSRAAAEGSIDEVAMSQVRAGLEEFLPVFAEELSLACDTHAIVETVLNELESLTACRQRLRTSDPLLSAIPESEWEAAESWRVPVACVLLRHLGRVAGDKEFTSRSVQFMEEWLLGRVVRQSLRDLGCDEWTAHHNTLLVKVAMAYAGLLGPAADEHDRVSLREMLDDRAAREFLQVNRHDGVQWFNKEQFEVMLKTLLTCSLVQLTAAGQATDEAIVVLVDRALKIRNAAASAGYQLEGTVQLMESEHATSSGPDQK